MAGELGAMMIIQKEISIPSSQANTHDLWSGKAHGTPRFPKKASPFSLESSADVSPKSLTDNEGDGSSEALVSGGFDEHYSNDIYPSLRRKTFGRSSPMPIIRQFPYGCDAQGSSRSSSSPSPALLVPRTPHDYMMTRPPPPTSAFKDASGSDVDDDAAFSFDIDINSLANASARTEEDLSKKIKLSHYPSCRFSVVSADTTPSDLEPKTIYQPPKCHKKHWVLPGPPVDPVEKAKRRRARRDAKRELRKAEFEARSPEGAGIGSVSECSLATAFIPYSRRGTNDGSPPAIVLRVPEIKLDEAEREDGGKSAASASESDSMMAGFAHSVDSQLSSEYLDGDGLYGYDEASYGSPRLIAEVLIVRKFDERA
jgi:hypothetical protein